MYGGDVPIRPWAEPSPGCCSPDACSQGEVQGFKENRDRLEILTATIAVEKVNLAEMQGRGEGGGRPAQEVRHLLHEAQVEANELDKLVVAQRAIPGFWIAPRAVYTRKLAEVHALEGRLQQLSEAAEGGGRRGGRWLPLRLLSALVARPHCPRIGRPTLVTWPQGSVGHGRRNNLGANEVQWLVSTRPRLSCHSAPFLTSRCSG